MKFQADEATLCRCLRITREQVVDCIAVTGAETVREVGAQTGAGTGCMSCHCRIRELLACRTERRPAGALVRA